MYLWLLHDDPHALIAASHGIESPFVASKNEKSPGNGALSSSGGRI